MDNKLQVFYNEESNVNIRTEVIDGEPWFVAKDVAQALGITWNGKTLDSIPDKWKGMRSFLTPCGNYQGGGLQELRIINEAALYKLAFRSNKPNADHFVNWVAGEVLPSFHPPYRFLRDREGVQIPAPSEVPPILRRVETAGNTLREPQGTGGGRPASASVARPRAEGLPRNGRKQPGDTLHHRAGDAEPEEGRPLSGAEDGT